MIEFLFFLLKSHDLFFFLSIFLSFLLSFMLFVSLCNKKKIAYSCNKKIATKIMTRFSFIIMLRKLLYSISVVSAIQSRPDSEYYYVKRELTLNKNYNKLFFFTFLSIFSCDCNFHANRNRIPFFDFHL